jgi:hypothetical protein
MSFVEVGLAAESHEVEVRHAETTLAPGGSWSTPPLGPLVVAPAEAAAEVELLRPDQAQRLCGRTLDWVEALGAR